MAIKKSTMKKERILLFPENESGKEERSGIETKRAMELAIILK